LLKFLGQISDLRVTKKITKGKRNYPKNRKSRTKYETEEERILAKKEQNRLGVLKWRLNKENKCKEKEKLKK